MLRPMIAAVLALAASPTLAAEPPTPIEIRGEPRSATFGEKTDVDSYSFYLKGGSQYAVSVMPQARGPNCTFEVRKPDGTLFKRVSCAPGVEKGFEIKAPVTGKYVLRIAATSITPSPTFPVNYTYRVAFDCLAWRATRCRVHVNQPTQREFSFTTDEDSHWFQAYDGHDMKITVTGTQAEIMVSHPDNPDPRLDPGLWSLGQIIIEPRYEYDPYIDLLIRVRQPAGATKGGSYTLSIVPN